VWYNPAWLFVNGFHRVFLRISQGASRLQEVLADRWAAFTYGGEAFERGLRHVIERSVHFNAFATAALNEVIQKKQPLPNLYAYRPSLLDTSSISYEIEETFRAEPSPYDSHPCPADRIRWVQAIGSGQASPEDGAADAWSLFRDREEIERRLTRQVRENIQVDAGISIPEEATA
jgi:Zn-dependent protease with chaperone function